MSSTQAAIDAYLAAGRAVAERHVAGSRRLDPAPWRALGYTVHRDARRGPEAHVDDVLIAQALNAARVSRAPRRTLVLATGDGNGNGGRASYPQVVEAALDRGWAVEVVAWRFKLHRAYGRLAARRPGDCAVRLLDDAVPPPPRSWAEEIGPRLDAKGEVARPPTPEPQ